MEDLFVEYKRIFSFKNNYLKYMKKVGFIAQTGILIAIIIVILGFYKFEKISIGTCLLFIDIISLLIMGNTGRYAIKECKRINRDIHKVKSGCSFYTVMRGEFSKCLAQKGIDLHNKNQMEYLLKLLDDYINSIKPKEYIRNGVFIGITLPIWNWYMNCMYSKFVTTQQQALNLLVAALLIVVSVIFTGYLIINELKKVYFSLVYSNYSKYKEMKIIIEDLYLYALNENAEFMSKIYFLK